MLRINLSIREVVKKTKEIHASFAAILQTAEVMATMCKTLANIEKALIYMVFRERPYLHNLHYSIHYIIWLYY